VPAAAERGRRGEFAAPADRAGGERVEQDPAKASARDLRPTACAVVGLLKQDLALLVEHPGGLTSGVDDPEELFK
jgi:hypothetical protein